MSKFHFETTNYDMTVLKEEEIRKLAQQIRAIIEEYGVERFQNNILEALEKHKTYYPTCFLEDKKCANTNK